MPSDPDGRSDPAATPAATGGTGAGLLNALQVGGWRLSLMLAVLGLLPTWGGTAHLYLLDAAGPPGTEHLDDLDRNLALLMALVFSVLALVSFWKLWQLQQRQAAFFLTMWVLTLAGSTLLVEIAARTQRPAWPASDLHGVAPRDGLEPWREAGEPAVEPRLGNSWGQRDRERSRRPLPGVRRIAFIGDSFLEESPGVPVSLAVERRLDAAQAEVINLGVSATAPDEYFYRLQHVALPLGCDACVMFIYLGNDLIDEPRTLETVAGVTAVTPRQSLLTDMGLVGLNHLFMNARRPVLQAWFAAGDLAERERTLHEAIQNSNDRELARLLIRQVSLPPDLAGSLLQRLQKPEMAEFFEMLRHPDAGRFRSYYLIDGLWLSAAGMAPLRTDRVDYAAHWIELSASVCAARQLPFLCVLIPDAFAVDPRLRQQWSPLADMRELTRHTSRCGEELAARLTNAGIEVLSLHNVLNEVPGTYLNLDGHWSALGVELAATAVADALTARWGIPKNPAAEAP